MKSEYQKLRKEKAATELIYLQSFKFQTNFYMLALHKMRQLAALVLVANLLYIHLINLVLFYKIGIPKIEKRKGCNKAKL